MLPPNPKDIPALYNRALSLKKAGQAGEALDLFERILLIRPNTAEALFQIGLIEAEAGDNARAERLLRQALGLKPKEAAIWQALHRVLSGKPAAKLEREARKASIPLGTEADLRPVLSLIARDPAAAEAKALAAVKQAPSAFWPAYALGRARLVQGKAGAALGPLDMAFKRDPEHDAARIDLGRCLVLLDQPARAEALLRPMVQGSPAAALALARSYRATLRFEDALELLENIPAKGAEARAAQSERLLTLAAKGDGEAVLAALNANSATAPPLHEVANILQEAGAVDAALQVIELGLQGQPGNSGLKTHRAQMRQSAGDLEGARADLDAVLSDAPDHAEAYRAYVAGQRIVEDDPVFDALQRRLGRPDLSAPSRRVLNFAAAKGFGDLGQDAEMFDALHRANRLMREAFPYGFEADLAEARALAADWPVLQGLDTDAPPDPVLFVTGLPRSGTTLVETILAAHGAVAAGGEMPFLGRALAPAIETLRHGAPDAARFAEAGARYLSSARRRTGSALFTDKAISTFSRMGHARAALPGARFILLKRDPRDVGLSIYRNMFPEGRHRYSTDLIAIGKYIRLHDAVVRFWGEALPDHVHVIDYDALTAEPEPVIRDLLAFCGLDWDPACLHPERSARRIETLSFAQARQPIGRGAVAGWRRHEAELRPLIDALETTEIDLMTTAPD